MAARQAVFIRANRARQSESVVVWNPPESGAVVSTGGRFGRLQRTGTGRRWTTRCQSLRDHVHGLSRGDLFEPPTPAPDFQQVPVMHEAVGQRSNDHDVAEEYLPVLDGVAHRRGTRRHPPILARAPGKRRFPGGGEASESDDPTPAPCRIWWASLSEMGCEDAECSGSRTAHCRPVRHEGKCPHSRNQPCALKDRCKRSRTPS